MAGRRSRLRGGLTACIPALALALPAAAWGGWAPPRELSSAASEPISVAATAGLDRRGDAVVLWHSKRGVETVLRSARRAFGQPHAIPGSSLSMPDLRPRLAFDARGGALAIWSYFEPHPRFVQDGYVVDYTFGLRVAGRGPNGAFGSTQTLTDRLDADPSADVAFDPSGTAVVLWTDKAGMHAAARRPGSRRFDRAQVISQTQADPQVSVGAGGSAVAAWASRDHGGWAVRSATAGRGKAFGRASKLPIAGLGDAKPVLAVDGRSAVTAAWARAGRVMAATCSSAGRCERPRPVSPAGETAADPHVAVAADGSAVLAWRSPKGVSASLRRGHGAFGRPGRLASLAPGEKATSLALTLGAHGAAAALWTIHGRKGDRAEAALRHAGAGRFATTSRLTGNLAAAGLSDPQVVLAPNGSALAIWGAVTGGHPSIQAADFDSRVR